MVTGYRGSLNPVSGGVCVQTPTHTVKAPDPRKQLITVSLLRRLAASACRFIKRLIKKAKKDSRKAWAVVQNSLGRAGRALKRKWLTHHNKMQDNPTYRRKVAAAVTLTLSALAPFTAATAALRATMVALRTVATIYLAAYESTEGAFA